ncbi:CdaR family protein [Clostridiaceae bacterium 35-E11]
MNNFVTFISEKVKFKKENSRFFRRNTTPKIVSIIFALVMWLYVMGEVNPESIIELANVKVQLLNVDELKQSGLIIIGQKDFTVNVKVSGRRNDVYKVSPQDVVARADVRGFQKGVNSVPLEISIPPNTRIEDISPKQIKITLDKIVRRQKPIEVKPVGSPMEGFEPTKAIVSPSEVIVEGPESLVDKVDRVVANVNVKSQQTDIIDKLPLKPVNLEGTEVNGVEVKNKYVDVTLPIHQVKEVPIIMTFQGEAKEGFRITNKIPSEESIVIKGPKEIINPITEIRAKTINLSNLDKTTEQNISLILPEGVQTPYLTKNPTMQIIVEPIKTKEFIFEKDEIKLKNLKNDYIADLSKLPNTIKVKIQVIESMVESIDKENMYLYLDLEGLLEGKYSVDIHYSTSDKVEKVVMLPEKVDIQIKGEEEAQETSGEVDNRN